MDLTGVEASNELCRGVGVVVLVNRELQLDGGHVLRRNTREPEAEAHAVSVERTRHFHFLVDCSWRTHWFGARLPGGPSVVFVGTLPFKLNAGIFSPLVVCVDRSENAHRYFALRGDTRVLHSKLNLLNHSCSEVRK